MRTQEERKSAIFCRCIWIFNLTLWNCGLYHLNQAINPIVNNPYHCIDINMDELSLHDQQQFLNQYLRDLSTYQLFAEAEKIDKDMLDELKQVCLNNPYIDYADVADRVVATKVHYLTEKESYAGFTSTFQVGNYIQQDVSIFNKAVQYRVFDITYFHEMMHALFPSIRECNFFEEALADIITTECYGRSIAGYPVHNTLTCMWIETLGVDVFKEMKATGSLQPMKQALTNLGYNEEQIEKIISHLNEFHEKYLEDKESTKLHSCLNDVKVAYQIKYQQEADLNPIMYAYQTKLLSYYDSEINCKYYDTYYFLDKTGSDHIWWENQDHYYQYNLKQEDYNLPVNTSKKLVK